MRRLLWILAWIGVAVWSLFAWGAYGLVGFFGDVALRNADVVTNQPEAVEWLSWALSVLRGLGLAAIIAVWAVVSLLILAVPAVLGLFFGRSRVEENRFNEPPQAPYYRDPAEEGRGAPPVLDLPSRRIDKR